MPGSPRVEELADDLGRILQVAVHDDDRLSAGMIDAGRDRGLVSEVPAEMEDDEPGVVRGQAVGELGGPVAAAVVDPDDLVDDVERVESGGERR